jgi:putative nucleotide binding protein
LSGSLPRRTEDVVDRSSESSSGGYQQLPQRKYEEYAYILDFTPRGKSTTVRGREGVIVQSIGEEHLTLLELLGDQNANFEVGERVYIGREGRSKVISVLGRLDYVNISQSAKSELPSIVEKIVTSNEKRFVDYINMAQALTPRIHALELIPGIGKIYMMTIIKKRETRKFASFADIQDRVGLRDPAKLIAKRIIDEITGTSRMNLFVRK